jgi:hypothetical protein
MTIGIEKAGPVGRALRLVIGICLLILAVPVWLEAGLDYGLASLSLMGGLLLFYVAAHWIVSRYFRNLNRWLGSLLAVTPVVLVWYFGQGGGPLFGQGEAGTAAITFIAISMLVDFARAGVGCEVMALPALLFRDRTHLPCIALSPIDAWERRSAGDE